MTEDRKKTQGKSRARSRRFFRAASAAVVWVPVAIAGCSPPDWANPVEWFEADRPSPQSPGEPAAAEGGYPSLASVPGEPPRPTPKSLRDSLVEGLIADRANARYTNEALTAQSVAVPPAAPPPQARPPVEIAWQTPRVLPEGETAGTEDAGAAADAAAPEVADAAAPEVADAAAPEATGAAEAGERVEIAWDTPRVLPGEGAGAAEPASSAPIAPVEMGGPQPIAVIYFAHDSSQLNNEDRDLLREVVALHKERGGRIHLVGHSSSRAGAGASDPVQQRMVNLDLSLKRAGAVADTLVDLGAQKKSLLVEAKAASEPASDEATPIGEAGNRRVEIFLEY